MVSPSPSVVGRHSGIRWKGVALLVLAAGFLIALVALWIQSVAKRRWAEMDKEMKGLIAEYQARTGERPVLHGAAEPGSAWAEYDQALQKLKSLKGSTAILGKLVNPLPAVDRVKIEGILASQSAVLDHLRRGATASNGQYPYRLGNDFDTPSLLESQKLVTLAAYQARFLAEAGESPKAARLLLDAGQFSRDLGSNGPLIAEMVGVAMFGLVFEELRALLQSGDLNAEALGEIERGLETLDRSFPKAGDTRMNEALVCGVGIIQVERDGGYSYPDGEKIPLHHWRYGFSSQLVLADAFGINLRFMRRLAELDSLPWREVLRNVDQLEADLSRENNPLIRTITVGVIRAYRYGPERRAQLRLLRLAVRYRLTGEILELEDPFGTLLHTSRVGGKLRVWSLNKDGVDDGGDGEWSPAKGKDIVLEVEK